MATSQHKHKSLAEYVRGYPKIELHAHLNGCIRESTLRELAAERGIVLSDHHFPTSSTIPDIIGEEDEGVGPDYSTFYNSTPRSLSECFALFDEIVACVSDLDALRRITCEAVLDLCHNDGVIYLEIRSTPKRLLASRGSDERTTKRRYIETVLKVFAELEEETQVNYQNKNKVVLRFLVSINRANSIDDAKENVDLALEMKRDNEWYSKYIVGMDLGGNPTKNDTRDFLPLLQRARDEGDLKVTIHCGEVPCVATNSDNEKTNTMRNNKALEEAQAVMKFRPDRLGHALLLPPSMLLEEVALAAKPIPVECCPTSNVMTLELSKRHNDEEQHGNLLEGIKSHPQLQHWLEHQYPISICTDDSGVFDTTPTKEWLLVMKAFDISIVNFHTMMLHIIETCFCDEKTKELIRQELNQYFEVHRA